MFLLAAAGLGAAFSALHKAQQDINDDAYDTRYDSIYWMKIVLGITSGFILAELVPINWGEVSSGFGKPALAMVGGFSGSLVHRVLNQIESGISAMFPESRPKPSDLSLPASGAEAALSQLNPLRFSVATAPSAETELPVPEVATKAEVEAMIAPHRNADRPADAPGLPD